MIRAENLYRQFDKRGIAGIHHLSFSLNAGEILGIMGPNGSGKSTLLKILANQIKSDSGTFSVDGNVVLFPTNEQLPSMNVQKFLVQSVKLEIEEEKKIQLARDLADTFEFTFQLRQNLDELSSGQLQKILLSKELINRPSLLLMDEPFTHLDPFTRKDILNGLFKYIKDQSMTVMWVTHDLEEALKFSDKIALMNFGKFEQFSSPDLFMRAPKNLFVAKFMGYRNFFPTKNSLWGDSKLTSLEKEDGILVVPDHAWIQDPEGMKFVVKNVIATKQGFETQLEGDNKLIYWFQGPTSHLLKPDAQVSLSPVVKECLHISL
jgi:ABC-type sugar transport system ATPase subunit